MKRADPDAGTVPVEITVNGTTRRDTVAARLTLVDYLRDRVGLRGTHIGCEQGVCGACTVLLDGRSVRSCLMLAVQADGHSVATVESLETGGRLSQIQQLLARSHALQCGFCTPGMLLSCSELLSERVTQPNTDPTSVADWLSGNLCRCTGYSGIVKA